MRATSIRRYQARMNHWVAPGPPTRLSTTSCVSECAGVTPRPALSLKSDNSESVLFAEKISERASITTSPRALCCRYEAKT
jgi:hypothetical protein